jgi:hypothetical protein
MSAATDARRVEQASTRFARDPFARSLGVEIASLERDRATLVLPHRTEHLNAGGVLNGGASASLLLSSGGLWNAEADYRNNAGDRTTRRGTLVQYGSGQSGSGRRARAADQCCLSASTDCRIRSTWRSRFAAISPAPSISPARPSVSRSRASCAAAVAPSTFRDPFSV